MYVPAPPHSVPAGPLAVRWLGYDLLPQRAGATTIGRIELENAGSAGWRSRPGKDIHLSYHWLDLRGNPIVWAGAFILLPERVPAGERIEVIVTVRAPIPPGTYRLAFDLVNEGQYWFHELGNERLELDVPVLPRIERRALAVAVLPGAAALEAATRAALERQDEAVANGEGEATAHLLAGASPAPDWSRRILDAHAEGYVAVAGSVRVEGGPFERRAVAKDLGPWRPGFGRAPGWSQPLLCPSVLEGVAAQPVAGPGGLPALDPAAVDGRTLCDGRIQVSVTATALRPDGRRRG